VAIAVAALFIVMFAFTVFYFVILKLRHARTNTTLGQGLDPILNNELDAEETEMYEVDGMAPLPLEIDSRQMKIHELPAVEEVASEMGTPTQQNFSV
jgi:hypothetical protein